MNQRDDKGERIGYWEEHWPNNLMSKGDYVNDARNGYWEFYWKNGNPWYKGHFINDSLNGYCEKYNEDCSLRLKEFYL